jgi:hypothetical protein
VASDVCFHIVITRATSAPVCPDELCAMRCALIVFLLLLKYFCASAIEHDSLCKKEELDCHEPSHIVFRLPERDDARAAAVAKQHDMRVVGQPFLDSHYFLQHLDHMNSTKSRRHKRETVERLRNSAHVEWVEEQRPRRRVKRDFIIPDENATDSGYQQERSAPRFLWKDPLFRDQWYLVSFFKVFDYCGATFKI